MRLAPALLALSLLAACGREDYAQVARVTPDETRALDEAAEMLGAPSQGSASPAATPGAAPPP